MGRFEKIYFETIDRLTHPKTVPGAIGSGLLTLVPFFSDPLIHNVYGTATKVVPFLSKHSTKMEIGEVAHYGVKYLMWVLTAYAYVSVD